MRSISFRLIVRVLGLNAVASNDNPGSAPSVRRFDGRHQHRRSYFHLMVAWITTKLLLRGHFQSSCDLGQGLVLVQERLFP